MILDAFIKKCPKDTTEIKKILVEIIESIGMVVADLGDNQPNPIAWYCADPDNQGMTASAILTTSHIVLHVWDKSEVGELHFDLYSCSDYDEQEITQKLSDLFGIVSGELTLQDRLSFKTQKIK
jgi:S-adenosylmethionine/arginine decarboxylase-like enzyme